MTVIYSEVTLDTTLLVLCEDVGTDYFGVERGWHIERSGDTLTFLHVGTVGKQGKPGVAETKERFEVPWTRVRRATAAVETVETSPSKGEAKK